MSTQYQELDDEVFYPESDGKPMADNTLQYEWIVIIKEGLEVELPNDFVAADLFWYPVKGNSNLHYAPDVMVALGRPKGYRSSYKQWEENNIVPQVVFEILSPRNTAIEMHRKHDFYNNYGVQEYYLYDPHNNEFLVWQRTLDNLSPVDFVGGWVSPLLGIRFQPTTEHLQIFHRDGEPFLSYLQIRETLQQERAEKEKERAEKEKERAEKEIALAKVEQEQAEKNRLKEKLRQLGIDPDGV